VQRDTAGLAREGRGGYANIAALWQIRRRHRARAVSTEMNNSGPQLTELAHRPLGGWRVSMSMLFDGITGTIVDGAPVSATGGSGHSGKPSLREP
jgi:hypothetical protein